jgi:hypothetical protein
MSASVKSFLFCLATAFAASNGGTLAAEPAATGKARTAVPQSRPLPPDAVPGGVMPTKRAALTPEQRRAVLVDGLDVLNHSAHDLTFARFVGALLESRSVQNTQQNREQFVQGWVDTFKATSGVNAGGITKPMTVRAEGDLSAAQMLDPVNGLRVVAVVNRRDSMFVDPADNKAKGAQMRIVFELPGPVGNVAIFKTIMEYDVQSTGLGKDGYRAYAQAWAKMETMADPGDRAQRIEDLFFNGFNGVPAIVKADNLGKNGGAFRTNSLAGVWMFRENALAPSGFPTVQSRSLGGTIDPEVYMGTSPQSAQFIADLDTIGRSLTVFDRKAKARGTTVTIGEVAAGGLNSAAVSGIYQPMEIVSDDPRTVVANVASQPVKDEVNRLIVRSGLPMDWTMAANRIGAGGCAQCHFNPSTLAVGATNFTLATQSFLPASNLFLFTMIQGGRVAPFVENAITERYATQQKYLRGALEVPSVRPLNRAPA